jgi:signal transduction histidine kinase
VALRDDAGRLIGVTASGRDSSERHRIEAALRTLNEELERRTSELAAATLAAERVSDSKSEFMSRLSHELRTPMSAVLGFTQLLLAGKGGPLGDVQRDYLAKVKRASEHVVELLNEVLDLAQVEAGRIDIECKPVPLKQLVAEVMELTQPIAEARGISVAVSAEASPQVRVSADARRLRQVLLNLLSNAIKYNFAGGRVTVGWVIDHGHARISVTDTGPGISPVLQLKLFQPFERLYPEHGAEGTGLGLTISRRLVELMGGKIGVTSRTGEGSTFWVQLTAFPSL